MGTPLKLNSLNAVAEKEEAGAWIDIEHPAGGPFYMGGRTDIPFRVRVVGPYSKTARDETKRVRKEAQDRRGKPLTDEDLDQRELATLAVVTLEWDGAFDDDGKVIPLTRENAVAVYAMSLVVAPFIIEQIDRKGGDHTRFFGEK